MRRLSCLFVVAVLAVAAWPGRSAAQLPQPGVPAAPRPVFSPYLNLLRRDSSPAVNYYGLVRPQIAAQNSILSLQQQVNSVAQAEQQPAATGLPVTGTPVYFLNTGGYFLNNRVGMGPLTTPLTTRSRPAMPIAPPAPPSRPQVRAR